MFHYCFRHIVSYLNELLESMAKAAGLKSVDQLTNELHVWPDFHGNRSPLADPTLHGMVRLCYKFCALLLLILKSLNLKLWKLKLTS